jgi:uncharacterized protein YaaR (DUF327 family)
MTTDDRRLIVETLAEMKELKGEMKEFKEHVIECVQQLEKRRGGTKQGTTDGYQPVNFRYGVSRKRNCQFL